jgi:hypothetical protein
MRTVVHLAVTPFVFAIGCSSSSLAGDPASDASAPDAAFADGAPADAPRDAATVDATGDGRERADAVVTGDGETSVDVGPIAEVGGACVFNRDCPTGAACTCGDDGCLCLPGARGTGRSGIDACKDERDCASGLCVEALDGAFVCSGPCDEGCGPKLPRCAEIATIGEICVREPPAPKGAIGTFSNRTWSFDHAFFGHDYVDGRPVETVLELHAGSDGTCPPPKKDPFATVIVSGLPGAIEAKSYPIAATFLGLDPALPIFSKATSTKPIVLSGLRACPAAARPCTFDAAVDLGFAEGTIVGTVRAIHCDSMDTGL